MVWGGYYGYTRFKNNPTPTSYILGTVEKGTLITSISGSGQVSVSNQVEIKPKTSGAITAVYVTAPGREVKTGALLAQIDTSEAARAVRDAQTGLETAKLELEKFLEPVDELTLLQSENSLIEAQKTKEKAQDDLKKSYDDAFTSVSNAFLDLPPVTTGLQDLLYKSSYGGSQENKSYYVNLVQSYDTASIKASLYGDSAITAYQTARPAYNQNFLDYKNTSRYADTTIIEELLNKTYNTAKLIAEAVKSNSDFLSFVKDRLTEHNNALPSLLATHQSSLASYTDQINNNLTTLLNSINTIKNTKDTIEKSVLTIKEKTLSLAKTKAAPDELDIRAKKIAIQQKQDALLTAQQTLADCYVRAPWSGVITKVVAKKGDSASSGTSLFTLITDQKLAEVSLNEIDVAKIKTGQKVNLALDAIPDLEITGEVAEIDAVGATSQGVVSYTVKIRFDAQDERIKPGMSVSAVIITNVKQDVLMIPNTAVKTQGTRNYVEMLDQTIITDQNGQSVTSLAAPTQQVIEIGLANDSLTEIVSGLKEGDKVIMQTNIGSPATNQSQSNAGGLRIPGLGGGGFRRD